MGDVTPERLAGILLNAHEMNNPRRAPSTRRLAQDVLDLCLSVRQAWAERDALRAERDAAAEEARALREAAGNVRDALVSGLKVDVIGPERCAMAALLKYLGVALSRPRTAHARIAEARERVVEAARVFSRDGVAWPLCNAVDALAEAERAADAPGR